ncbi:ABC transporter ATP-binding protein [Undibacterium sp. SXout7W]|uniref:ABC transporter ATP-binding protein n=1 Tax=Undibacterium sp. SXout7W TaxID=3413049 RepID=UPI003BF44205
MMMNLSEQDDYSVSKPDLILQANTMVELRGISKRYANGNLASDNISICIQQGEIHAIIGENGAGKSTLMKMLYGMEKPDTGAIIINGQTCLFQQPADAIAAGVGLVPQHLQLLPSFTVAQNIVLGHEPKKGLWIDDARAVADVLATAHQYGLDIDPKAIVATLSLGEQQRVEIIKTLYRGASVILLDEPTAVLSPQEAEALFVTLRKLVKLGVTIILITHKLMEVREVAHRFTVLRNGRVTGMGESGTISDEQMTQMIVGRPLKSIRVRAKKKHDPLADPLITVRNISLTHGKVLSKLHGLCFDIAPGEILGVAGVEGNGQNLLAEIVSGLTKPDTGDIAIAGVSYSGKGIRAARMHGVASIPEDRLHNGIAKNMSLIENVIAVDYHKATLSRMGVLDMQAARNMTVDIIEKFKVVAHSPELSIGSLSGGNMQKLIMGRELSTSPRLLVASQPTRGVDIGSTQDLHQHLQDLCKSGAAILLISADIDEILTLSDRIMVMFQGQIVAHFKNENLTAQDLGAFMTGSKRHEGVQAMLTSPLTNPTLKAAV